MVVFLVRRILASVAVFWVVVTLTFIGLRVLPGGPFDLETGASPEVLKNLSERYGLDRPVWEQYGLYIGGLLQGDLGESYQFDGRPVLDILGESVPVTLTMGLLALILALGLGIPAGVYAASRHGALGDSLLRILAMVGVSIPSFLLAPLLILILSSGWPLYWLWPSVFSQMESWGLFFPSALWLGPKYWVLPVLTLAFRPMAFILRLTRASFLEKVSKDFVRTARAKGLGTVSVFYRHLLKNSLGPVLAYGGPLIALSLIHI